MNRYFQHFPRLRETINYNHCENNHDPINHINIIQQLRFECKRRLIDFRIVEPVARFVLNPFSGHIETKAQIKLEIRLTWVG